MIYDLTDTSKRDKFDRKFTRCEHCQSQQRAVDQCPNSTYRDVILVPPPAIRAVIFGTDVGTKETAEILRLLEMPEFSHVLVYWSSLHSDQYVLQYNLDRREGEEAKRYSLFMQQLTEKQIAMAKGHVSGGPEGLKYRPSKKGICYVQSAFRDCGPGA